MSRTGAFTAGIRLFRGWKGKTPEQLMVEKLIEEGRIQILGSKIDDNILEVTLAKPVRLRFLNHSSTETFKFKLHDVKLKLYSPEIGHIKESGNPMERVSQGVVIYTAAEIIAKALKFTMYFIQDPVMALRKIYMREVSLQELNQNFKEFRRDLMEIKKGMKEGTELKNNGPKDVVSLSDIDEKLKLLQRDLTQIKLYIKGAQEGEGKMRNKGLKDKVKAVEKEGEEAEIDQTDDTDDNDD